MAQPSVSISITLDNGEIAIMQFITQGRSMKLPSGAFWIQEGVWQREPNTANIQAEITKTFDDTYYFINGVQQHRPQPISWRIINVGDIPINRTFRKAWKDLGVGSVVHDVDKVKTLAVEGLRQDRDKLFSALDAAWMKLVAQWVAGTAQQRSTIQTLMDAIEVKRQALRDAPAVYTAAIAAATTVEEIIAAKPTLVG